MENFNVGDSVMITNSYECYSSYAEWVGKNIPEKLHMFTVGKSPIRMEIGTIVAIAEHARIETYGLVYAVEIKDRIFLMCGTGIVSVKKSYNVELI